MENYGLTLKCSQCGNIPSSPSKHCGKCGGIVKVKCSQCGFFSDYGRHYCEKCGNPLPYVSEANFISRAEKKEKPKFKLEIQSLQDAVDEIGNSFRKKLKEISSRKRKANADAKQKQRDADSEETPKIVFQDPPKNKDASSEPESQNSKPGRIRDFPENKDNQAKSQQKKNIETETAAEDSKESESSGQQENRPENYSNKSALKISAYITVILLVIALCFAIYYIIIRPYLPKLNLTIAAKDYLSAFTQGRYEDAYKMLSSNSKLICPLEDYLYYNKHNFSGKREFRNIEVHSMTSSNALVKYQLRNDNGEWEDDYTSFILEQNKWTRPYAWTLYQPINEALTRKDYLQALYLAQKLYMTDPANPVSSSYLCKAEYLSGLYDKAAESCDNTLQSIEEYPIKMPEEDINWAMIYLANSLTKQNRKRAAYDAFDKLEERQGLTAEQQCDYRYGRAELFLMNKENDKAKSSLQIASGACLDGNDKKSKTLSLLKQITGKSSAEAISFAQRSKIREDLPPIEILRRQIVRSKLKQLGKNAVKYAPIDSWKAEHLGGADYRVSLISSAISPETGKTETNEIFAVIVNLWQNTGAIEKNMEIPEGF